MTTKTDVAIIGGGAAGCAVAYYLAKAGVNATIIEREGIGLQASGNSAGGLNPLEGTGIPGPLAPLAIESFQMHLAMWDELIEQSGVDFLPQMVYKINVAYSESELPALESSLNIYQSAPPIKSERSSGFTAHWMDAERVYEIEPRIGPGVIRALYEYGDTALNSHLFTVALAKAAEKMGASVQKGTVTGIEASAGRATGLTIDSGDIECETVVIASGPWSGDAGKWLDISIPIEPFKGEIVRVQMPNPPLAYEFSSANVHLFGRRDNLIWIGATEERAGFDMEPSQSARKKLLNSAAKLLPDIAKAKVVRHTACLRPLSKDGMPIIGKAPSWDNVFLATGAGKKGILISPGIGKSTADLITTGATELPISEFTRSRFA